MGFEPGPTAERTIASAYGMPAQTTAPHGTPAVHFHSIGHFREYSEKAAE